MTKRDKLLERFKRIPPPSDFTWDELVTLMRRLGYEVLPGKGSHSAFHNAETDDYIRGIPKPHKGKSVVMQCYLKIIRKKLTDIRVIQ